MSKLNLDQIIKLASDQYQVENATETIRPAADLPDVFAPPHHGPQNIPIAVQDVDHGFFPHFVAKARFVKIANIGLVVQSIKFGHVVFYRGVDELILTISE